MFRFLNEINDEIAREEKLLQALPTIGAGQRTDKGSLILRGPKGNKTLVKQRRYVDLSGHRKSEEVIIGAADSEEAINYIGCEYNVQLASCLNENIRNLKSLSTRFKPFGVEDIVSSLPEVAQRVIAMAPSNAFLASVFNLANGRGEETGQGAMNGPNHATVQGALAGGSIARKHDAARLRGTISNAASGNNGNPGQASGKGNLNNGATTSSGGMLVRSKSEAIICNLLNQYSIEYVYEGRMELRDEKGFKVIRKPDFTITTKKGTLIWEHLGLLDNDEYFETNASKLRLYWRNGFVLNENLIVTVDEPGGGINARTIDRIIKDSIVPYMV